MNTLISVSSNSPIFIASSTHRAISFLVGIALALCVMSLPAMAYADSVSNTDSSTQIDRGGRKANKHRRVKKANHGGKHKLRKHKLPLPELPDYPELPENNSSHDAPELDANGLGAAMILLLGSILVLSDGRKKTRLLPAI
jgi:hypothetical protein